jgi:hypothetical protein
MTDHVPFHGTYELDVDRELAELGPPGYPAAAPPGPDGDDYRLR